MKKFGTGLYPPGLPDFVPLPGFVDPQDRWLKCDGAVVLRSAYPNLYATLGQTFKTGTYDNAVYFQLPTQSAFTVPTGKYAMIFAG